MDDVRLPWSLRWDLPLTRQIILFVTALMVLADFVASAAAGSGALPYTVTRFFDGDAKVNFPTGFKTTMLLAITLLLLAHSSLARRESVAASKGWRLLAYVTAFAFMDETIYLHQSLSIVLHDHLHTGGILRFAWTVVYVPMLALAGVFVIRHMHRLTVALRLRLLAGAVLYGVGAVGMEPIKSLVASSSGEGGLPFKLISALSDSLEMVGLAVLALVLLTNLSRAVSSLQMHFVDPLAQPRR